MTIDYQALAHRYGSAMSYHQFVAEHEGAAVYGWLALADTAMAVSDLPLALALVHPRVAPVDREIWDEVRGRRNFRYSPSRRGQTCWSHLVWGYTCPYTSMPLQLDHAWPFAYGGPADITNAVWLCSVHNRAKSDDVHAYAWADGSLPDWLRIRLQRLRRLVA